MKNFAAALAEVPVIAIVRGLRPDASVEICQRLWDAGVSLVEVTVQDEKGFEALEAAAEAERHASRHLGAGSVKTSVDALRATDSGAEFLVSPGLSKEVISQAFDLNMPYLPGIATATELQSALDAGLDTVKVFPASDLGGPRFVGALRGPFPEANLVPTGGVSVGDIDTYIEAGALGVGLGSSLFEEDAIQALSSWLARRTG